MYDDEVPLGRDGSLHPPLPGASQAPQIDGPPRPGGRRGDCPARLLALDAAPIAHVPGRPQAEPSARRFAGSVRPAPHGGRRPRRRRRPRTPPAPRTAGLSPRSGGSGTRSPSTGATRGSSRTWVSCLVEGAIPGVDISKVPTHDPWGTEYRVGWSADRKHFRIVSAWADREFEKLGEVAPGAAWGTPSLATDPKRDIVFQDGVFLQCFTGTRADLGAAGRARGDGPDGCAGLPCGPLPKWRGGGRRAPEPCRDVLKFPWSKRSPSLPANRPGSRAPTAPRPLQPSDREGARGRRQDG